MDKATKIEVTTPEIMTPAGTNKMSERKIDKSWWIIGIAVAIVAIICVVFNINSNSNEYTDVTGLVDIDNGDQKVNWDRYATTDIELTESVEIRESGVYHITGSLTDGVIMVDVGDSGEVKLILDNVSITNSTGPAIACMAGDDLVVELVGENTLIDGSTYAAEWDQDVKGVIYSKADLTFEGDGTLNITANYQDAVVGKDDVKFNSGTYKIVAVDDGIRGKDSVYIVNGSFDIMAQQDAIKSTNDTDVGKGFVLIEDGDINISAGDDGIHAEKLLTIQNGKVNVAKSYEGLEAQKIIINGGDISVIALDDGINASGESNNTNARNPMVADEDCELTINGGNVYVNAGGDGVDSNGWVYFNGGKTVVDGPTNNGNGALDAGAGIVMSGGEVIAVGSSGMAETLGNNSSVYSASVYFSTVQTAGTVLQVKNSAGEIVAEHTAAKTFSNAAIGTGEFAMGETYTIYINGEKYQSFTIDSVVTNVGNTNSNTNMMMPGGGNRR